ncbi:T9SS C-terminal target domain-containing protein [bacterium]|nr:T9SS C-terminal target domain-containing protein [bacterium]
MPGFYLFLPLILMLRFSSPIIAGLDFESFGISSFFVDPEAIPSTSLLQSVQSDIFSSGISDSIVGGNLADLEKTVEVSSDVAPGLVGTVINYPNPFRADQDTQIGFELSQPMTVDIRVYDQFGSRIFSTTQDYDSAGYRKVTFNRALAGGRLSAGLYYILLIHKGKVIGKCKMVVLP